MNNKPYSLACDNNKAPILEIIQTVFKEACTVVEIGSGTGQHACYFAEHLPHLIWQTTDRLPYLSGINAWLAEANLSNLPPPICLEVCDEKWPFNGIEALFSANTLHIMSLFEVEILFQRLDTYLNPHARLCFYGPFNYKGKYTSDSNAQFDVWLKQQNNLSGIKNNEDILALAASCGCELLQDIAMPANNRILVFEKTA